MERKINIIIASEEENNHYFHLIIMDEVIAKPGIK